VKKEWKEILYKYITGIIQNNGHKVLAIDGMTDHIHILVGLRLYNHCRRWYRTLKQIRHDGLTNNIYHPKNLNGRKDAERFHIVSRT